MSSVTCAAAQAGVLNVATKAVTSRRARGAQALRQVAAPKSSKGLSAVTTCSANKPSRIAHTAQPQRDVVARAAASPAATTAAPATTGPMTMFDKIWAKHVIDVGDDGTALIYIDRHLVHEVTSPQAFEGLRTSGRSVRRPAATLATVDHNVPTSDRSGYTNVESFIKEEDSRTQVMALEKNVEEFGVTYFGLADDRQGIVHIIGPEQGFTLPGMTIVCGDSHTATHGAFGALAFGIGTSEVEHVLATQTLLQKPAKNMRVTCNGKLAKGVTSKDLVLHIIGKIGTAGGTGHVIEFAGDAIASLSMEGRMTICNMAIEAGARAGMIAPDQTTFDYLKGRPMAPFGAEFDKAVQYWQTLPSDKDSRYDKEAVIDAAIIPPTITWGTSPEDTCPIDAVVPDPENETNPQIKKKLQRSLEYMGLTPGQKLDGTPISKVFIGSCTNGRIEDIREVAKIALGRKVAPGVHAMVVPGSGLVKQEAEAEGLHTILMAAGFDWREPGCSMCLAMNPDKLEPGQRCASTSNRNFEGRQGNGGRTHLMSPMMAAAAAITGTLTDIRNLPPVAAPAAATAAPAGCMTPFIDLTGKVAALDMMNVDTDMIIPKNYLKTIKRTGLGVALFSDMRYNDNDLSNEKPDFVLNKAGYRSAAILVAGENFGCGSSREHAPWALNDFGIRCIIAPSFADIFFNNCFKNGMLPIALPEEQVRMFMADAEAGAELTVDLPSQTITRPGGEKVSFHVDAFRKHCLLNGLDDIGLTLQKKSVIDDFESSYMASQSWLFN